jgi:hypothetical protein
MSVAEGEMFGSVVQLFWDILTDNYHDYNFYRMVATGGGALQGDFLSNYTGNFCSKALLGAARG